MYMTLKHRPFKDIYYNGENKDNLANAKRIKGMTKGPRKPRVHMTPELFERLVELYKKHGNKPGMIAKELGISQPSAATWIAKARQKIAKDAEKAKSKAAFDELVEKAKPTPAPVITVKSTEEGYYEQKYMTLLEQFNSIMKENEKLKLKIEVLNDLVRGR